MNPFIPKARAWFDLIRIYNLPIPLCGMLAGVYATDAAPTWRILVVLAAALLGCAVTQSYNDYEDCDVDRINAPFRPLPSGRLERKSVLRTGHGLAAIGALMSVAVEPITAVIVVATFLLTRFYPAAKRLTSLNHLMMPAALALTPLYGSLIVHGRLLPLAVVSSVAIFLGDINMNVVGSFKDLWGSSEQERVLPVTLGARPAVVVALATGLAGIAVQLAAVALGWAGAWALLPLGLALILMVGSRLRLYREPSARVGYAALQAGRIGECLAFPGLIAGVLPVDHSVPVIASCLLLALYTQTIIPEAVLPEAAALPIGAAATAALGSDPGSSHAVGQVGR